MCVFPAISGTFFLYRQNAENLIFSWQIFGASLLLVFSSIIILDIACMLHLNRKYPPQSIGYCHPSYFCFIQPNRNIKTICSFLSGLHTSFRGLSLSATPWFWEQWTWRGCISDLFPARIFIFLVSLLLDLPSPIIFSVFPKVSSLPESWSNYPLELRGSMEASLTHIWLRVIPCEEPSMYIADSCEWAIEQKCNALCVHICHWHGNLEAE